MIKWAKSFLFSRTLLCYGLLAVALVTYLALSYAAPQTSSPIKLSRLQLDLVEFSIILPYLLSWILAVYGLCTLDKYVRFGRISNELKPAFQGIYRGLAWIIVSAVSVPVLGATRPFIPHLGHQLTILTNYLYIFPLLIGFWIMRQAMAKVLGKQKMPAQRWRSDEAVRALLVLLLSAFYIALVFSNGSRQAGPNASYFLPDVLIVLTIIIPACLSWWFGFSAGFMLSEITARAESATTFRAMTRILYGICTIIFISILLQALLSLGTARLADVGVGMLLALLYVFVLWQAVGYMLLALGVRALLRDNNAEGEQAA